MPVTDEHCVREFLDGDDSAFVALYQHYKSPVFDFSVRMLGDTDEAGDIVQGVFLKVWERRGQLRRPERFAQWLMAMTRNDCLSALRKRKNEADLPDDIPDLALTPAADQVQRRDEIGMVCDAVGRLKPELREVIVLREYHEYSYREIGAIIGVDEDLVRSRLFSARRKLHEMLKDVMTERSGL